MLWHTRLVLGVLIAGALALRVWGIPFGLPQLYHADEPGYVELAQRLIKTGDFNPHFFNYPTLFFYLNSLAYLPYYAVGYLTGYFQSLDDIRAPQWITIGAGITEQPGTILLARALTTLFSVGCVAVTFALARRLEGRAKTGLLAAFLLAISPTAVMESRFVAPDSFVTFFTTLSVLCALRAYDTKRLLDYALAGICVGLSASTKYNGCVVAVALLTSALARHGVRPRAFLVLGIAALSALVAFAVTSPFVFLDHQEFLKALRYEARHYSTGHAGVTGSSFVFYARMLLTREVVVAVLLLAALGLGIFTRNRRLWVVLSFPVLYFIFIARFQVHNDRTLLPFLPSACVAAAHGIMKLVDRLDLRRFSLAPRVLLILALVAPSVWPLGQALAETRQLRAPKARAAARGWIESNLAEGSRIAIEGYGPYVDPERFQVKGFGYLAYRSVQFYRARFDYLVFGSGAYQRFLVNPEAFPRQTKSYRRLFRSLRHVRTFEQGGETVRIYATNRLGPSAR